ncbi:DUF2971 domain-containing protein [uncultured Rikenella sp.]|uniref:DUF2971 domain-containing protein n=2 Tax=uncultured Rikenella sp. TaxID=368003 RepID=UPI002729B983|nr:DUF2971 domain-containing protein [uncultured Rikenella sp.]
MSTFHALMETLDRPEADNDDRDLSKYKFKFRGTLMPYMNDPIEYSFMSKCICQGLDKYERNNQLKEKKSIWLRENLKIIDEQMGYPGIVSFSEWADDLTLWRSYGGNGTGIALGFSKELLQKSFSEAFVKCRYGTEEYTTNYVYEHLSKELYDILTLSNITNTYNLPIDYFAKILSLRLSTKHQSYFYEREWRITRMYHPLATKFYDKQGSIIPYIEISIPVNCLKEVVIGPCAQKELSAHSIFLLLANKLPPLIGTSSVAEIKDKIAIAISDVPYVIR